MTLDDAATWTLILSGVLLLLAASGVALDIYDWWLDRTAGRRLREKVDQARGREARGFDDWWSHARWEWDDEGEALPPGAA